MKSKIISDDDGVRTHVVVLDAGEEAFKVLTDYVNEQGIAAAHLTAIGAFEKATIGFFEYETKSYKEFEVSEQSEVLSAIGDVAVDDEGKSSLHIHVVLGLADTSTCGGHFIRGVVRPTFEVVLVETYSRLRRKMNPELGIALIDLDGPDE